MCDRVHCAKILADKVNPLKLASAVEDLERPWRTGPASMPKCPAVQRDIKVGPTVIEPSALTGEITSNFNCVWVRSLVLGGTPFISV